MRILQIASHLDVRMGGSILAAAQIATTAQGDGIECTLAGTVIPGSATESYFREHFPSIRIEVFPMQFPRHSFNSGEFRRWLDREAGSFDLIHIHGLFNFPYLFAGRAAVKARRPLVISPHNSLDPYDLRKKAWLKRWVYGPFFVRALLERCAVVHCCTRTEGERLIKYGASPSPTITEVPLPIVPLPEGRADGGWRKRHQIDKDDFLVLFLSRMDRKKGLDLLVGAFLRLARNRSNVILAIAGTGDEVLANELRRTIAAAGLASQVRWLGFVTGAEKLEAYRECDVFALPSYNENFGLVVVEAMFAAKPVLISREVYIHQTVAKHDCADVCETTVDSVYQSLTNLINDPERRLAMGTNARSAAFAEFSPEVVRERFRKLYRTAASRTSAI